MHLSNSTIIHLGLFISMHVTFPSNEKNIEHQLIICMLKYLQESVLMSTTYFEVHYKNKMAYWVDTR